MPFPRLKKLLNRKNLIILGVLALLAMAIVEYQSRYLYNASSLQIAGRIKTQELYGWQKNHPSLTPVFTLIDTLIPDDNRFNYGPLTGSSTIDQLPIGLIGASFENTLRYPYDVVRGSSSSHIPFADSASDNYPALLKKLDSVAVHTEQQFYDALSNATPGNVITLSPGIYHIDQGRKIRSKTAGTPLTPIIVRAQKWGEVVIELDTVEGFLITHPYWVFENLMINGACESDDRCQHAIHVSGDGRHTVIRNNEIRNFNAHIKINAYPDIYPDGGLIENNSLLNDSARLSRSTVAFIDSVAASDWLVRRNYIADYGKSVGDRVSYGAYFKGGGYNNKLIQNIFRCESSHGGGIRVGLSLGGGGTGKPYFRNGTYPVEHSRGVIANNLIEDCPYDVGIYLNKSADTLVFGNTLHNTVGIDVRFPESYAVVHNNLIEGRVLSRDGGSYERNDGEAENGSGSIAEIETMLTIDMSGLLED